MAGIFEAESTLTDRYQTTVPETVRRALQLDKRDKIHYTIRPGGEVVLSRVQAPEDDPVIEHFLSFLASDIVNRPQHLQVLSAEFVRHMRSLVEGVDVDLDAPLSADDE